MNTHAFHKFWLKITAFVIGSFGPIFSLASRPETSEPARLGLDILAWPIDGAQQYNTPSIHFLSALTGGFLTGWGIMTWCLSIWVYDHAPDATRKAVVAGMLAWFITDSLGSIASGFAVNVVPNVVVLLLGVGPLWRRVQA